MTRSTLIHLLTLQSIIQAWLRGEAVEVKGYGSGWKELPPNAPNPQFENPSFEWRLKPEPFVLYVVVQNGENIVASLKDRGQADETAQRCNYLATRSSEKRQNKYTVIRVEGTCDEVQ